MKNKPINLAEKFAQFSDHWAPRVIAEMNDYQFKLVKFKGEFVWHNHPETDEVFIVLEGKMTIKLRQGAVDLEVGEIFVVEKGLDHRPRADQECKVMLFEPRGVLNTGDTRGRLTADQDVWI